jgi:hypothetical protein
MLLDPVRKSNAQELVNGVIEGRGGVITVATRNCPDREFFQRVTVFAQTRLRLTFFY